MITFPFTANAVVNFQVCSFPARSTRTAANLYIQISGIADFNVDPDWDAGDPLAWNRGTLTFETPQPVLQDGDTLLEFAITSGMRQISRDEGGAFSVDDFGIALDSVDSAEPIQISAFGPGKTFGKLTIKLDAGYKGDIWVRHVSFIADLLVYRPSLDNVGKPMHLRDRVYALLSDVSRVLGP